jgi:hypothetical protein
MKVYTFKEDIDNMKAGKSTLVFMSPERKPLMFFETATKQIVEMELKEGTDE